MNTTKFIYLSWFAMRLGSRTRKELIIFEHKVSSKRLKASTIICFRSEIISLSINSRKSEVIEQFQITFPSHSTLKDPIRTDNLIRAYDSLESKIRVVHRFFEMQMLIVITVLNKVVNIILFNFKHFNGLHLMVYI